MTAQKQKGTSAETGFTRFLQDEGILALRNPPSGAKDKGDITVYYGNHIFTLEVKNHRKTELAEWIDEALTEQKNADSDFGIVIHKRPRKGHPKDWYVTMNGAQFVKLLKLL